MRGCAVWALRTPQLPQQPQQPARHIIGKQRTGSWPKHGGDTGERHGD